MPEENTTAAAELRPVDIGIRDPKDNSSSGAPAAGSSAKEIAPKFGGLRAGRKRIDGLTPGSPEALEADRKKDRDRKARKRNPDPDALPSANNSRPGSAPVHIVSPEPGPLVSVPVAPVPSFVPWEAKTLEPLFKLLIPAAERADVRTIVERAEKSKLPRGLVERIEHDARWPELSKTALEQSCPEVAAKWLNYFGISAENKGEVVIGIAVVSIAISRGALLRRIDKAAAQIAAAAQAPPAPEKKEP